MRPWNDAEADAIIAAHADREGPMLPVLRKAGETRHSNSQHRA